MDELPRYNIAPSQPVVTIRQDAPSAITLWTFPESLPENGR